MTFKELRATVHNNFLSQDLIDKDSVVSIVCTQHFAKQFHDIYGITLKVKDFIDYYNKMHPNDVDEIITMSIQGTVDSTLFIENEKRNSDIEYKNYICTMGEFKEFINYFREL